MKYNDFMEAQDVWAVVSNAVNEVFSANGEKQLVIQTDDNHYWLWSFDSDTPLQDRLNLAWCFEGEDSGDYDDVSFSNIDSLKEWLFELDTDCVASEWYVEYK